MVNCPCGTGKLYTECCEPLIAGRKVANTPEALMRSRYCAYACGEMAYISHTMRPPAANHFPAEEKQQDQIKWIGLEIIKTVTQRSKGWVEFKAHYTRHSMPHVLHEVSEFHLRAGIWYYVDGTHVTPTMITRSSIGRNAFCLCGSGKKYKKCCGY
jgi:SEC-C motif-containing protein